MAARAAGSGPRRRSGLLLCVLALALGLAGPAGTLAERSTHAFADGLGADGGRYPDGQGWRARLTGRIGGTQTVLDARIAFEVGAVQTQLCSATAIRAAMSNALAAIKGALLAEPLHPGIQKGPVAVATSRMVSSRRRLTYPSCIMAPLVFS